MPLASPFASPPAALRITRRRLLLAAAASLLAGCSSDRPREPLRLATNEWPGYEPLHLARERGYWGEAPIRLYELPSTSEVLRALRNGALDAAAVTSDEALSLLGDRQEVRAVLVLDISNGGDALVTRPNIRRLADLKGLRIGVENQALGAYMLSRILSEAGLNQTDLSIVPLTVDTHENAYLAGAVDGVITSDPALSRLQTLGARTLYSSRQMPGEIFDLLVVREEAYRQHHQTLRALGDAWFRVLDELGTDPAGTASALGRRTQTPGPRFQNSLAGLILPDREQVRRLLASSAPEILPPLLRVRNFMEARGLLVRPVNPGQLLPPDLGEVLAL